MTALAQFTLYVAKSSLPEAIFESVAKGVPFATTIWHPVAIQTAPLSGNNPERPIKQMPGSSGCGGGN